MSRKTLRISWAVLVLFGLFAAVILDRFAGRNLRENALRKNIAGPDADRYHGDFFSVLRVIDGDTLDIDLPDGDSSYTRLRLLGVDTPETKDSRYDVMYFGPEAENFSRSLCENQAVRILIDTQSPSRDRYNRLLCYVVFADGTVLNELLIEKGYGYADLRFPHSRYRKFVSLMEEAARNRQGLWKDAGIRDLPQWLQKERPSILNETRCELPSG